MYLIMGIPTKHSFSHFLHRVHFVVSTTGRSREYLAPTAHIPPITQRFLHPHLLFKNNDRTKANKTSPDQTIL